MPDGEYVNTRRATYGDGAQFVPVCEKCGRFVIKDKVIYFNGLGELKNQPNATCKKCGRTKMLFEGFF